MVVFGHRTGLFGGAVGVAGICIAGIIYEMGQMVGQLVSSAADGTKNVTDLVVKY